jgi:hypothetical protein
MAFRRWSLNMPFEYVLDWNRGNVEKISVTAYPRYSPKAKAHKKPAFVIGAVEGSRAIILRDGVEDAVRSYGSKRTGTTVRVHFPKNDTEAIAKAYRIGLAAAVLENAPNNGAIHKSTSYILDATNEEVWFWTSKLLDKRVGSERTVAALCIVSGARSRPSRTVR